MSHRQAALPSWSLTTRMGVVSHVLNVPQYDERPCINPWLPAPSIAKLPLPARPSSHLDQHMQPIPASESVVL